jgi:hypothetical protein
MSVTVFTEMPVRDDSTHMSVEASGPGARIAGRDDALPH